MEQSGLLRSRQSKITPIQLIYLEGCLAIFLAVGSLTWPLGGDHAFFYFVGNTILDGGVPYRDAWELKGPLTYYIYAFIAAVFGQHEFGPRIFDLIVVGAFCWWLRRMILRLERSTSAATFGVVFFLLWYLSLGFWNTAQPEEWGAFLVAIAVGLLIESSESRRHTMAAIGILIALAVLLKPTFLIFLPLPILVLLFGGKERVFSGVPAVSCALAFAATVTMLLTLCFWDGGLKEYWDVLRFLGSSYSPLSRRDLWAEATSFPGLLWQIGLAVPYFLALPALGLIWHTGRRRLAGLLAAWLALAILLVLAQGTYWWYSFAPANIATAVIIGTALSYFTGPEKAPVVRHLITGLAALVIALPVVASEYSDCFFASFSWPSYVLGAMDRSDYVEKVAAGYHIDTVEQVAAYIESHTAPSDAVFVWGWESLILTMTKRHSPTRFATYEALITDGPLKTRYQQIFLAEVTHRPPRYVVVDGLSSFYRPESSLWLLKEFEQFNRFLHRNYRPVTRIGEYEIWRQTDIDSRTRVGNRSERSDRLGAMSDK